MTHDNPLSNVDLEKAIEKMSKQVDNILKARLNTQIRKGNINTSNSTDKDGTSWRDRPPML